MQVREIIEDQIVNDQLKEDEQAPSTNQLEDEGILYKKRGICGIPSWLVN